jgi:tetratricopeptide (TPR) repeat protein
MSSLFRLFVIFILLTASLESTADNGTAGSFLFFTKAVSYYRADQSRIGNRTSEGRPIDTIQFRKAENLDFETAYKSSWEIGLYFLEQGKHPQALDIFNSLKSYLDERQPLDLDKKKRLSAVFNIIGAIYEETGLWNGALDFYMNSLQICNEIGFNPGKAKVYNNIGKLYFNRMELKKAEDLFLKAIQINKELNIRPELFINYNNLAGVYKLKNDTKKALDYALIALNQLDPEKDHYDLALVYSNIGNLYQDLGNHPVSLSYYEKAIEIQESQSFQIALIRTYLSVSSAYQVMNNVDSAESYIRKSLILAEKIGNPSQTLVVLQDAARFFHETGQYKLSSTYYADYKSLNDSLESLNSLTRIEQIQAVYEVINKEKDNQILQQKINLQQLAIQRQRIILLAVSVIFILLAYFFFSLLRNRKRERANNEALTQKSEALHQREKEMLLEKEYSLELELDYKNRQLTSHALNLARNNELIQKTSEELKLILLGMSARDKERSKRIRNLLSTLQQYSTGNDWEEFRLYFQEVHQSFEKNLAAAFPDLSPNDKKICALLKLGLSTKDIASITFRELRSVESARNRLRKKLGITTDVNITNFLSQF